MSAEQHPQIKKRFLTDIAIFGRVRFGRPAPKASMLRLPPSTSHPFSASLPRFKKKTPASKHGSLIFVRSIRMKNNKYFTAKAEREEEELLKVKLKLCTNRSASIIKACI
jgi:hypothetical protein